jgi:hypothetical protein
VKVIAGNIGRLVGARKSIRGAAAAEAAGGAEHGGGPDARHEAAAVSQLRIKVCPEMTLPDPFDLEKERRRIIERLHDRYLSMGDSFNENASKDAQAAIRIALVINGGAAAGVLAFLGGLAARDRLPLSELSNISHHLKWFIYGVIAAGLAAACAYVVNYCYAAHFLTRTYSYNEPYVNEPHRAWIWIALIAHAIGFLVALASLGAFSYGIYKVTNAIGKLG